MVTILLFHEHLFTKTNANQYRSGFPNNFFGLDAINNQRKRTSGDTVQYIQTGVKKYNVLNVMFWKHLKKVLKKKL
jgi:hypothetical protein